MNVWHLQKHRNDHEASSLPGARWRRTLPWAREVTPASKLRETGIHTATVTGVVKKLLIGLQSQLTVLEKCPSLCGFQKSVLCWFTLRIMIIKTILCLDGKPHTDSKRLLINWAKKEFMILLFL